MILLPGDSLTGLAGMKKSVNISCSNKLKGA